MESSIQESASSNRPEPVAQSAVPVFAGEPRVTSTDIKGRFPNFARIELSDLSKAAERGQRLASTLELVQGRVGVIALGLCGGGTLATVGFIHSLFSNAPLSLKVGVASIVAGLILGAFVRGRVERLFDPKIRALLQPSELLKEAKASGLVCDSCAYPLVDLPHCPECGPKK